MLSEKTHLSNLVNILVSGGVAVFPTDTVIGLGCLPNCESAVNRLARIKQRAHSKAGFILLASNMNQLDKYVDLTVLNNALCEHKSSVPTTYIVPSLQNNTWLNDRELGTQAVRITDNSWIKALCERVGCLVSTSANISGFTGALSIGRARMQLGPQVDYYCTLANHTESGQPSQIFDTLQNKFLRQ